MSQKNNKNLTKIIVALISASALIITACINHDVDSDSKNDSENKKDISKEGKIENEIINNSDDNSNDKLKSITEEITEDKPEEITEDKPENQLDDKLDDNSIDNSGNQLENSGDNTGVIILGDDFEVDNINVYKDNKENIEEKVTLTGKMDENRNSYIKVNNEMVNVYQSPVYKFQMLNENKTTIDIENVFVEVINYKKINESTNNDFNNHGKVVDNILDENGASIEKMIFWNCNISPELKQYQAILLGHDKNNTEDLSDTEYVKIDQGDTGQFKIEIYPDTPGIYTTNIIVKYTSYKMEVKELVLQDIEFAYNPNE